jgi:hypothetical protein
MCGAMRTLLCFAAVVLAAGCGGGGSVPDAGTPVDSSCGIDCAAQATFGLLQGSCFEYSASNVMASPPDLAAEVEPVVTLEGGVKVMQVRYTTGGQLKMQDSFTIVGTNLKIVRREWGAGNSSVSYEDSTNALQGVDWLQTDSTTSGSFSTMDTARVIGGTGGMDATTFAVTLATPSSSELAVPYKTYDSAVKMLLSETPDHGVDSRRIFVPQTGFSLISTPLAQGSGGTSQEYRLQNVKNTADAGTACGF